MARKKQHIDEFFKDRLKGSDLPLDGTEWTRLANALQPQKKKRRFFWWWFALVPVILVGYLILRNQDTPQASTSTATEQTPTSEQPNNIIADINADEQTSEVSPSNHSLTVPEFSNTRGNADEMDLPNGTANTTGLPSDDATWSTEEVPASLVVQENDSPEFTQSDVNPILHAEKSRLISRSLSVFAYQLSQLRSIEGLDSFYKKKMSLHVPLPVEIGLTFSTQQNKQSIVGPNDNSARLRNFNEQNALGHAISLEVNTQHKGWMLGSGLGYEQRKLSMQSPGKIRIQLYDSIPFVDLNKDTTWLPWNYRDTTITGNFNAPSYQILRIPIRLGRNLRINNRLSVEAQLNLSVGIMLGARGDAVLWENYVSTVTRNQLRTLSLNAGLRTGLNYSLSSQWTAKLNVHAEQDLSNLSGLSGTRQRFTTYGGQIGLFYTLER